MTLGGVGALLGLMGLSLSGGTLKGFLVPRVQEQRGTVVRNPWSRQLNALTDAPPLLILDLITGLLI